MIVLIVANPAAAGVAYIGETNASKEQRPPHCDADPV